MFAVYIVFLCNVNDTKKNSGATMDGGGFDLVKSMQSYVNRMTAEVAGLKVLLLDVDTTTFVSLVMPQSQLLNKEVFLINRLEHKRDKMKHLKCICFLRPTSESIQYLVEELRDPCYAEYHLFFSNMLKKTQVERLAEADDFEVVKEVQEYFGDYLAVDQQLFHFNLSYPVKYIYGSAVDSWDGNAFQRSVDGLLSIMLSLKKRPLVRYSKNSAMSKRLAQEVHYQMQQETQLFDFRRPDTWPLLLILDRRNDPVTPLLNQWTYQAMIHELIGFNNGRVNMSSVGAEVKPDLKEIVLSADQDPFYKKNMYLNLGDLGANIKSYVEEYQIKTKSNMKIESIAEMKRFVEEYPEFKRLSGNVTKHVALVGELSKIVEKNKLLIVGELEQNLASLEQHAIDFKTLQELITNPAVTLRSKVRLSMLYALRYEKSPLSNIQKLFDMLGQAGVEVDEINAIKAVMTYAGADQRQEDIFSNESILSKGKSLVRGLQGVENVYTQHEPQLKQLLDALKNNKLKEMLYPFVDTVSRDRPQDVIIFVIGGVTYAEARIISQFNAATPGMRIVLGGTAVHNSSSFIAELIDATRRK